MSIEKFLGLDLVQVGPGLPVPSAPTAMGVELVSPGVDFVRDEVKAIAVKVWANAFRAANATGFAASACLTTVTVPGRAQMLFDLTTARPTRQSLQAAWDDYAEHLGRRAELGGTFSYRLPDLSRVRLAFAGIGRPVRARVLVDRVAPRQSATQRSWTDVGLHSDG